ncbi:PREDICTED: cysteine-rich receptor-like protein kinase 10 [Nelumbo nucifera]|nr:PREDICTED: cysteine-rich receptor-like protein kinase 10 [Nelumbo nucifera]
MFCFLKPGQSFSFLVILFSWLSIVKSTTDSDLIGTSCQGAENYTAGNTFESNLRVLLPSLAINGSTTGFYNATLGENPNTVFGLGLCRGDIPVEQCRTCLEKASEEIIQGCSGRKSGVIWYEVCMLRYSDHNFFSTNDLQDKKFMWNENNVTDPNRLNQILVNLITNLSSQAVSDPSKLLFATGSWQGARILLGSCILRYELHPFFEVSTPDKSPAPQPQTNTTRTSPSTSGGTTCRRCSSRSRYLVAILVPTVIVTVVAFSGIFIFLMMRSEKKKPRVWKEMETIEALYFKLDTIEAATAKFSNANKLGEGGFGPVYKGKLLDGKEIAVKRLSNNSRQGIQEFKNEVALAAKLQHKNLVRILGCCIEERERILVYEYVPNKSLDTFLFDSTKRVQLNWSKRYKIIKGIARGLLYLHEDSPCRIIHCDLKTNNILLDRDFCPKIADFGMARLFQGDYTQGITSRIAGTYGYMAPEYAMHGNFSVKSDVFSFGVILLEIVSGQRNSNFFELEHGQGLLSYIWRNWREGTILKLIDPAMVESCEMTEVFRCIHIGLLCVEEVFTDRPSMSTVNTMLNTNSSLRTPSPPALVFSTTGSNYTST